MVDRQVEQFDPQQLESIYRGVGSLAYDPRLMLKVVLYEYLQGHRSPSQWHRHAKEHATLQWLGRGIEPSRTAWYQFRDRIGNVVEQLHDELIRRAITADLLDADEAVQDGTTVAACASRHRVVNQRTLTKRREILQQLMDGVAFPEGIPKWVPESVAGREKLLERMTESQQVLSIRLAENAKKPKDKRLDSERVYVSLTDPQSALGRDKHKVYRPLYTVQFMVEPKSLLILGYLCKPEATDAGTLPAMIDRVQQTVGGTLTRVLADAAYATLLDLIDCEKRKIELIAPVQSNTFTAAKTAKRPVNNRDQFIWDPVQQTYHCPAGHLLQHQGKDKRRRHGDRHVVEHRFHCSSEYCADCPLAQGCVSKPERGRTIKRLERQELLDAQRSKMEREDIKAIYQKRGQVIERAFADAKQHRKVDRFQGRGPARAATETGLLVLTQNLLTLDRLQRRHANPCKQQV